MHWVEYATAGASHPTRLTWTGATGGTPHVGDGFERGFAFLLAAVWAAKTVPEILLDRNDHGLRTPRARELPISVSWHRHFAVPGDPGRVFCQLEPLEGIHRMSH